MALADRWSDHLSRPRNRFRAFIRIRADRVVSEFTKTAGKSSAVGFRTGLDDSLSFDGNRIGTIDSSQSLAGCGFVCDPVFAEPCLVADVFRSAPNHGGADYHRADVDHDFADDFGSEESRSGFRLSPDSVFVMGQLCDLSQRRDLLSKPVKERRYSIDYLLPTFCRKNRCEIQRRTECPLE